MILRVLKGTARTLKLGDKVHLFPKPVARALGLPCIDPATKELRPESACAKRRALLNGDTP